MSSVWIGRIQPREEKKHKTDLNKAN